MTINTPSMLCVEDYIKAIDWAINIGGIKELLRRVDSNFKVIKNWASSNRHWVEFLSAEEEYTSPVSVCLRLNAISAKQESFQRAYIKHMAELLSAEGAAFDIVNHVKMPPSLRIWCGPTIEEQDIAILTHWLEWAYFTTFEQMMGD